MKQTLCILNEDLEELNMKNNSKLANAVSQSEKFPRKFKIKHSKFTIGLHVKKSSLVLINPMVDEKRKN